MYEKLAPLIFYHVIFMQFIFVKIKVGQNNKWYFWYMVYMWLLLCFSKINCFRERPLQDKCSNLQSFSHSSVRFDCNAIVDLCLYCCTFMRFATFARIISTSRCLHVAVIVVTSPLLTSSVLSCSCGDMLSSSMCHCLLTADWFAFDVYSLKYWTLQT